MLIDERILPDGADVLTQPPRTVFMCSTMLLV